MFLSVSFYMTNLTLDKEAVFKLRKRKKPRIRRFKAFGAARQIRIDATASRTVIFHIREAIFLLFQGVFLFFDDVFFGGEKMVKGKRKGNYRDIYHHSIFQIFLSLSVVKSHFSVLGLHTEF